MRLIGFTRFRTTNYEVQPPIWIEGQQVGGDADISGVIIIPLFLARRSKI